MKIVINDCFGGFNLSREALDKYAAIKGIKLGEWNDDWGFYAGFSARDIDRNDPVLVSIVEDMGEASCGDFASLRVVEIPDDVKWEIVEYDGSEHVAEQHRTWC